MPEGTQKTYGSAVIVAIAASASLRTNSACTCSSQTADGVCCHGAMSFMGLSLCLSVVGRVEQQLAGAGIVPLMDGRVLRGGVHVAQPALQRRGLVDDAAAGEREASIDDAHA